MRCSAPMASLGPELSFCSGLLHAVQSEFPGGHGLLKMLRVVWNMVKIIKSSLFILADCLGMSRRKNIAMAQIEGEA